MNANLINEDDLVVWFDIKDKKPRAKVEKLMRKNGIKIIYGDNGSICTTISEINGAITGNSELVEF